MTMEAEIEGMLLKAKDASNARNWEGAWLCPCLDFVQLASRAQCRGFLGCHTKLPQTGLFKTTEVQLEGV